MEATLTLKEAADRVGVTPATLKRWAQTGVIPGVNGKNPEWTPAVISHARIVARLRERLELSARSVAHERVDGPLPLEQFLDEVTADEPCCPGDEVIHFGARRLPPRASCPRLVDKARIRLAKSHGDLTPSPPPRTLRPVRQQAG